MECIPELNPSGDWSVYERPFRHIRAQRVFRKEAYQALERAFVAIRDDDPRANPRRELGFRRTQTAYDALIFPMGHGLASRFAPLFERRWIDFLGNLLNLAPLPQIDGALHHIPINSRSGWIHNDFCSGWFSGGHTSDIAFPDRRNCDYFTGATKSMDAQPKEFVRAATMIFYLQNDEWKEGCGGETGLYACSRSDIGPLSAVHPVSNSVLLFDCSPHSYHSLLANPGCPRNSIILWLHCSVDSAQSRWGHAFTRRKPR